MEEQVQKNEAGDQNRQEHGQQEQLTLRNEGGMSTVEIILILVVLIALVIIFKSQITALVSNIFSSINNNAATIY